MSNDIITISNSSDSFKIFTDEQVVAFMHEHAYPIKIPVFPVNDMLRSTKKNTIQADGARQVGLNAVLVSLLYKKHPSQVKFVLVDPKKVELTLFKKIERHFLAKLPNAEDAIITDNTKVVHTLNSLCIEMDNRYALLEDAQVRNNSPADLIKLTSRHLYIISMYFPKIKKH